MSSPTDPEPPTPAPHVPPGDPAPRPLLKPARGVMTMRDIAVAVGVLVVIILVVAGVSGSCSFAPGGPTVDASRLPVVDAPAELRTLARTVPFDVRIPAVPPGWRANSTGQDLLAQGTVRVVRTGYLTPDGRYLRLLQSDATEPALLAVEAGTQVPPGQGAVDVGGQRWVVYGAPEDEPVWVGELPAPDPARPDPVRLLITGSGSDEEFRALAGAATTGELLAGGS